MNKKGKNKIKLSKLSVGDLFFHEGIMYEIISKTNWESKCRYLNDKWRYSYIKYLYCSFSNHTVVEI